MGIQIQYFFANIWDWWGFHLFLQPMGQIHPPHQAMVTSPPPWDSSRNPPRSCGVVYVASSYKTATKRYMWHANAFENRWAHSCNPRCGYFDRHRIKPEPKKGTPGLGFFLTNVCYITMRVYGVYIPIFFPIVLNYGVYRTMRLFNLLDLIRLWWK